MNAQIRTAWELIRPPEDPEIIAAARQRAAEKHRLIDRAKALREVIFTKYMNKLPLMTSPNRQEEEWYLYLRLFDNDDVLWMGNPDDTGQPRHVSNFRTVLEWASFEVPPANFTCYSTYKPGSYSRCNEAVATRRYLVVEGDQLVSPILNLEDKLLNRNRCAAVFAWLQEEVKLNLRMVVDSGNKSLHGWFEVPEDTKLLEELKLVLPAIGCDKATLKLSQPVRCPGAIRDLGNGNYAKQSILYYA